MHSKPKLALATLTSPGAAFEEIIQRKLLGTGLFIAALAGTLAALYTVVYAPSSQPIVIFTIGKQNPLAWVGLCMLYAFVLHKLLNWLGTKNDYPTILTIMGWSQMTLVVAQVVSCIVVSAGALGHGSEVLNQVDDTLRMIMPVLYVVLVGVGIQTAYRVPLSRGALTYFVVAAMAFIAFSMTYAQARSQVFQHALSGIATIAGLVAASDTIPWLAAGVIGLVLGLWQLAPHWGWDNGTRNRAIATTGLVGALVFGLYVNWVSATDYYGRLLKAQQLYNNDKFAAAAQRMEAMLSIAGDDPRNMRMELDIADAYFLAGRSEQALAYYEKPLKNLKRAKPEDAKLWLARISSSTGAVHDFDGKYDLAVMDFEKAAKIWPEFREPWVRMAVTYDRMGNYKKAIESANHAVQKLNSEAAVAWVALAQGFAQTDEKQAKVAITMVADKNADLAKKIGSKPEDWANAVSKLTRVDLKYPLEEEVAPPVKQETKQAKPGKDRK